MILPNESNFNRDVIIEFKNITKKFGNFVAVDHINIQIFKGEILGFLGPNGAGKTTTMKMLAGILHPTEGSVWIKDELKLSQLTLSSKDRLLNRIGFLVENPSFYDDMTSRQLLTYFAKLKGFPRNKIKDRVEEVVKLMNLYDWIDKKIGTFSKGMKQKIGICSAIVHDPDVIVLDEPQSGLDPQARKEVRDFIIQLKNSGKTIFISSHLLYEISEVADRVSIISHGKILAIDTLENLEQIAQRSSIFLNFLEPISIQKAPEILDKMGPSVYDLCGLKDIVSDAHQIITYHPESGEFEIQFDGKPETQYILLSKILELGFKVIEFSVPKASLLENLYLNIINSAEKQHKEVQKSQISIKTVL